MFPITLARADGNKDSDMRANMNMSKLKAQEGPIEGYR